MKNCCDFLVCTICWLAIGYPIAFGSENGGMFGSEKWVAVGAPNPNFETGFWPFWFFQWSFASATCTIVSGAGAERCSFQGYIVSTALLATFVYPVVVHSMWCGSGWLSSGENDKIAVFDFAGSGVVHLVGGTGAFMIASIVGARDGRFGKNGEVISLSPHNLVMAATGGLLLLTGWFGFNGGSTAAASGGGGRDAGRICAVTAMGAAAGGMTTLLYVWYTSHFIMLEALINGILAGLVSITGACNILSPIPSVIAGSIGGFIYMMSSQWMLNIGVDDPLDAAPIHGFCGIWGMLVVGIFGNGTGGIWGIFYDTTLGGDQLWYQIIGIVFFMAWTSIVMGGVYTLMMLYDPTTLRVPIDIELAGDLVLYGGSAYPQFGKESGNAPASGEIGIVITDVQDSTALWSWNEEVMVRAIEAQYRLLRDNIVRFHGFEFMDEGDSLSVAFHDAFDAVRFCLISQGDLMALGWPDALYDHPSACRDGLYSGLRVRFAMDFGFGNKFLNQSTNRLSYEGDVVDSCSAIDHAVADGGVVVCSTKVLREMQEKWSHRLYELGPHFIQDLGTYKFANIEDPVALVQMLPDEIKDRPASVIEGCECCGKPYAQAPGVGDPEADIALMFCTFSSNAAEAEKGNKSSGEKDEITKYEVTKDIAAKVNADTLSIEHMLMYLVEASNGYVTKTSSGVSLLSFPGAEDGVNFCTLVSETLKIPSNKCLDFCAGLHVGVPSEVSPNASSGRADYLGPPVNLSARLLSLASSQRNKFGDGNMSVAVSEMAHGTLDSEDRGSLASKGEFNLKGVEEPVECYAFMRGEGGAQWAGATGVGDVKERRASRASMGGTEN